MFHAQVETSRFFRWLRPASCRYVEIALDRRLRVRRCGPAAAGTISRRRILALLVNHPDGTPDQDDDLHPLAGRDLPPKTTARGFPLMRPIYLFAREAGM